MESAGCVHTLKMISLEKPKVSGTQSFISTVKAHMDKKHTYYDLRMRGYSFNKLVSEGNRVIEFAERLY